MYSEPTQRWLRKERLRLLIRRTRQGVLLTLLLVVVIWGFLTYQADHHTFAWDRTVEVAVVALVDAGGESVDDDDTRFFQRFLSRTASPRDNLRHVEEWLRREYRRHTGEGGEVIRFEIRGPIELSALPPPLPGEGASFFERLSKTDEFVDYFSDLAAREDLLLGTYDVTLFVYFYDMYDKERSDLFGERDSIANRRNRVGVVFAPISYNIRGYICGLITHELCHILGATDKYDNDGRSVFPDGFAEPNREPLYPQEKAEIMSLGIPKAPGEREDIVNDLDACVVSGKTAEEMNWIGGEGE